MRQGKAFEKANEWEAARTTYQKLEKIKGQAGIALYLQAWVAIHTNDTDAAIRLSSASAALPGNHKTDAKFLYGDALYKQGEYKRAKDVYLLLRKSLTGEAKATATRKTAAANKMLKLPEMDGIVD
jgi:TolA-binding protein